LVCVGDSAESADTLHGPSCLSLIVVRRERGHHPVALAPALIVMWMLMTHLDLRNPLVFDTRSLGRRAGAMIHDTRSAPAPDDFGTDVIAIPTG
jgi:hypothetical protein